MPIRLVSTDFDGTLIGHPDDGRCTPALARALADFKASAGIWAINTGRSLSHTLEGVMLLGAPVEPDFLLTHEREIYHRSADGQWRDYGDWNRICRARHAELFHRAGPVFARIRSLVAGARDVTLIEEPEGPVGLITSDESVMDRVVEGLRPLHEAFPEFGHQRNTIYLRFCHTDYHKGSALGELCRLEGIAAAEVFAIGDHYNDLSMLDPRYAANLGCPTNAIPEVKAVVRKAGGWIAEARCGDGVAASLALARRHADKKRPAAA
jgi:hydroxymethylpyrimidine pyrophosphatase-like HAD family hydrolase